MEGANPTVGAVGQREIAKEVRIEMSLDEADRRAVEKAVRSAHPYEEPAIDFLKTADSSGLPAGRLGKLPSRMTVDEFLSHLESSLGASAMVWAQDRSRTIERVAVVGGAAADEWRHARNVGAHAFVTGEVPQHVALEAGESGMVIAACGHYHTEHPGCEALARWLNEQGVTAECFEPEPGQSGRPITSLDGAR